MVEYLEYKGEKLPVRLSYKALKMLKGANVNRLAKGIIDPEVIEKLLWGGLVSGHKIEEKELKLKEEEMEDILDVCFNDFVQIIPKFFPTAKISPNPVLSPGQPQEEEESQGPEKTTTEA